MSTSTDEARRAAERDISGTIQRLCQATGGEVIGLTLEADSTAWPRKIWYGVGIDLIEPDAPAEPPAPPPIKWTRDTPTEPGWYWMRGDMYDDPVRLWRTGKSGLMMQCRSGGMICVDTLPGIEWAGPLQEPPQ